MRIRTIKPEFWQNEQLFNCSEFARLLAIALLNLADDEGYFLAHPAIIRGHLFPYLSDLKKVETGLLQLQAIDFIKIGTDSQGRNVGCVTKFLLHQKIDRARPSVLKDYVSFDEDSTNTRRNVVEASTEEWKGMEGNGTEETEKEQKPKVAKWMQDFEQFWQAYPKKAGKTEAAKCWQKIKPDIQIVLAALSWQTQQHDWHKDGGQFIPHPSKYLNRGDYNNEKPPEHKSSEEIERDRRKYNSL